MLNTSAFQHPKLQGPEEKFLKVLSRKNKGTGKNKEKAFQREGVGSGSRYVCAPSTHLPPPSLRGSAVCSM